jgi:3-phosphoshikimate 1-carboxyvinyltransferase
MNVSDLYHPSGITEGKIALEGSKSIANRVLIIKALCPEDLFIENLPRCDDTMVLQKAIDNLQNSTFHVNLAGTAGRFLTALFAVSDGTQIIDADEGLRNRPVKPLLDALRTIGCSIESMHGDDRFPLRILPFQGQVSDVVTVSENISSQFITALLLTAPVLPQGLTIHLSENQVSAAYIDMTIQVMAYFGVHVKKDGTSLHIAPQVYKGKDITIEGDWSSASYYFGIAALSHQAHIILEGLFPDSWQGDTKMMETADYFGISSRFEGNHFIIEKTGEKPAKPYIEFDFIRSPDLFQTIAVTSAALSMHGMFTGLDTLPYKESDRVSAIQQELQKCGVFLSKMPQNFARKKDKPVYFMEGSFLLPDENLPFKTYKDHRMAMSLAILALKGKISLFDPDVVTKSYPGYWNDLTTLGFLSTKK